MRLLRLTTSNHSRTAGTRHDSAREGATLVEVLMALLVMSIGVVSVATLFPLSILRSVRATQLTNAKLLEGNVQQIIRTEPRFISGAEPWEPLTGYSMGDVVTERPQSSQLLPQDRRYFIAAGGGVTGVSEPNWDTPNNPMPPPQWLDGSTGWNLVDFHPGAPVVTVAPNYVVDPLGVTVFTADGTAPFAQFGNDRGMGVPVLTSGGTLVAPLPRLASGFTAELAASLATSLPDSWETQVNQIVNPANLTATAATLSKPEDVTGVDGISPLIRRVVISTEANAPQSVTRSITTVNTGTGRVGWVEPLPLSIFNPAAPTALRVRLETFDRRYSWFITVRRDAGGKAEGNIVVAFKRAFNPADEQIYFAPPSTAAGLPAERYDGDDAGPMGNQPFVFDRTDAANPTPQRVFFRHDQAGVPQPLIAAGNYAFDPINCYWYRIINVVSEDPAISEITIDPPAHVDSDRIMLLPGIIHVFPFTMR